MSANFTHPATSLLTILFAFIFNTYGIGQVFNFYGTEYYLSPDSLFEPGTSLTPSGTNLSGFNFSSADPSHPIFTTGIYYAIQDCGNRNLWVRLKHIAHDPNGTTNGFNIAQTLNSPFLPIGSTDRIGGWAGFLYDIRIFSDENLEGTRANRLGGPFNTNITVESLETLYNDGGILFEWLSFEILNEESSGWMLNSINFTGINPFSSPGFSSELRYSTTATLGNPPEGFSTDFPAGSRNIYAVDLNLSSAQHSEFRMSASGVSHFRYGYEFHTGGYQGMSMAFGGGPEISPELNHPLCSGDENGSINLLVSGYEPIAYSWNHGDDTSNPDSLGAGEYSVTITDGAGCAIQRTYLLDDPDSLQGIISFIEENGSTYLEVNCVGGTGSYSFLWNNGETGNRIFVTEYKPYSVEITDENGCVITAQYDYVSVEEISGNNSIISVFPNPVHNGQINFRHVKQPTEFKLYSAEGRLVHAQKIDQTSSAIALPKIACGLYYYHFDGVSGGKLLIH